MGHHVSLTSLQVNFNRYTLFWGSLKQWPEPVDKTAHMLVNKQNKIKRMVGIYWLSFNRLQPVRGKTCLFEGQSSWLFVGHLSTKVFENVYSQETNCSWCVFLKWKAQILFFFRSAVLFNSQPLVQKYISL